MSLLSKYPPFRDDAVRDWLFEFKVGEFWEEEDRFKLPYEGRLRTDGSARLAKTLLVLSLRLARLSRLLLRLCLEKEEMVDWRFKEGLLNCRGVLVDGDGRRLSIDRFSGVAMTVEGL